MKIEKIYKSCLAFVLEVVLMACFLHAVNYNLYLWAAVAVNTIILGFTTYNVIIYAVQLINNFILGVIERNNNMYSEISGFLKAGIKNMEYSSKKVDENLFSFIEKGQEYMQNTNKQLEEYRKSEELFCQNLQETERNSLENTSRQFIEIVNKLQQKNEEVLSELKESVEKQNKNIEYILSDFISSSKDCQDSMVLFLNQQKEDILNCLTEQARLHNKNIEQLKQSTEEININMQIQNKNIIKEFANTIESYSSKMDISISGYNKELNKCMNGYIDNLKSHITVIEKENIENLEKSYRQILDESSYKILDNYEKLLFGISEKYKETLGIQLDSFNDNISELYTNYYMKLMEVMDKNAEIIKQEIHNLYEYNTKASQDNKEKLDVLLINMNRFTSEMENSNNRLDDIIINGLKEDKELMSSLFKTMEASQKNNLEIFEKSSKQYMKNITDKFNKSLNENMEHYYQYIQISLKEYIDLFVEKSAEAIGKVQEDNNEKLKQAYSSISKLAEQEGYFIEEYRNNNKDTMLVVNKMITGYEESFELSRQKTAEDIAALKETLDVYSDNLYKNHSKLFEQQAQKSLDNMNRYKEYFVEANAKALANVQKENFDIITKSHEDISILKEQIDNMIKNSNDSLLLVNDYIKQIKNAIEKNGEDAQNILEDFNGNFEDNINNMGKKIKNSFSAHENNMQEINKHIEEITKEYHNLFEQVIANQREMNSLNKEDLDMLKKWVKQV